ncbi:MAG TPA: TonB-dependent receptor [Desulfobacterales bacterium]|nr:TonB-dependent receptor [Desulfobacterales bacterium]
MKKETMITRMPMPLVTMMILLTLFCPGALWAEEAEGFQVYTLGEIVVKGERSAARDVAITTEVTPEDFEATNAFSVPEALTYTPGVVVTTGTKNQANISVHGFGQERILTLIDGVPYYETNYGKLDLSQISLDSVARIDVVKGSASALYGANALGGVINIITKKPTEKPSLSVNAEYGVDGLEDPYKVSLSHGMKRGALSYWLSYAHREWDSWELSEDFDPQVGTIRRVPGGSTSTIVEDGGDRENSDYENDNFWAKVGLEPSEDTEVYASYHYIKTEKGLPPDIDFVPVFYDDYFSRLFRWDTFEDWGVDLSGKHTFTNKWSLQATLFYHNHKDDLASYDDLDYTNRIGLSNYEDYLIGGMVLTEFRPVHWDTLKLSINYRGDSHEQRADESLPFAESFAYTGSVGLENEALFIDNRLSVVVGASYDWYDTDKAESDPNNDGNIIKYDTPDTMDEFNPMVGASYRINDATRVFASVARKTRFPTLNEMFTDPPNLGLEAETSTNYIAGISWAHEDILNVEVSPFCYNISDYITSDLPDNPDRQYFNYQKVKISGVEFNVVLTLIENLLIKAGYTYTDAKNKSSNRVTSKVELVPEYKWDLGLQYVIPSLETKINLTMLNVGESYDQLPTFRNPTDPEEKSDDYTFFNAKITQPIMDHFEAYLSVDNAFDKDYQPEKNFPAPGRTIWLGASFKY